MKQILAKLPDSPGVYFFVGPKKEILYIGKATSLKDRVKSYFSKDLIHTRGPLLVQMLGLATSIKHTTTDSVLEAYLLETQLIKKHQPRFNTDEKDNKSFNHVVITNEEFPQVLTVRAWNINEEFDEKEIKYLFGPFPESGSLQIALKIIRKIFPWRDERCLPNSGKPCFNRQIGLCPGVCTGEISKADYGKQIQHIRLFFEGKKSILIKTLAREMKAYVKEKAFENAARIRNQIYALEHIQDIALIKNRAREDKKESAGVRIEAYDIAHISGTSMTGVMVVVEDGFPKKSDYRKFKIRGFKEANDPGALREVLERRFNHPEWQFPTYIVVDGSIAQVNVATDVVTKLGLTIPIIAVVKDERHKAREILGDKKAVAEYRMAILLANSEAHRFAIAYHKKLRGRNFLK